MGTDRPEVASLAVRSLLDNDQPLCQPFACGDAEWEREVSDYLRRKFWLPGRTREDVLIAFVEGADDVFGYGAWKATRVELPQRDEPVPVIRVCYFGVDSRFQGARDPDGRSWAGRLYATVEQRARSASPEAGAMPLELYCHQENAVGRRFWESRGYRIVDPNYLAGGMYLQFLRVPD